ncbi:hypothetical protein ZIOFF_005971 [Zingiber officinale]|uniref:nucleoside-diphosphate kinase n=1 Tax=Zingiber officinale TaxID=94328 RepID=A0A8J5HRJ7_ZINOF|nr:hypothetical protein ZIOFF_005971 [Zingiber officinale]
MQILVNKIAVFPIEGSNSFSPAGLRSSISAPLFVAHAIAPVAFGDPAVGHPADGDAAHAKDAQSLASPMRKLKGLKLVGVECSFVEKHYTDLSAKPFFGSLVEYIISGPVVAMVHDASFQHVDNHAN